MEKNSSIGFVSSTISESANESHFQFIISKEENSNSEVCVLHQFDVVMVKRASSGKLKGEVYAIVESIASISDAPDHVANFVSNNFGHPPGEQKIIANKAMPRMEFYCVLARVLSYSGDNEFPVRTGDEVFLCKKKEEIYRAIYANYSPGKKYFPVAPLQLTSRSNKKPYLLLDVNSILGPDAAHLNVSGMSGMASKTTKALTILRSLFNRNNNVSVVIFNTKDEDLLDLQKKNNLKDNDESIYRAIDNEKTDWDTNLRVYRPGKKAVSKQQENYILDFKKQQEYNNLDLIVAGDLDANGTMDSCVKALYEENKIFDTWASLSDSSNYFSEKIGEKNVLEKYGITDSSVRKFIRIAGRLLAPPVDRNANVFEKDSSINDISILVSELLKNPHSVIVVDIAPLNPIQQSVVFGCVLRTVQRYCKEKKEGKGEKQRIAVFVDELNKYASYDLPQTNPILEMLIDIAETGRSMGLGLITAEQSLSVIHRRIKTNIANLIIGRTMSLEMNQLDYCMIPESYKSRISTFNHEDALIYTTYLNAGAIHAKFPDKFYENPSAKK